MERMDFNDEWKFWAEGGQSRMVTLPHDAMMESGRSADAPSGAGGACFRGGIYHYEKSFELCPKLKGKTLILEMEGVYPKGEVLLNGSLVGQCFYGYSQYDFDLTGLVREGTNTLSVTVDHSHTPDSRWYSGGGIIRPVSLLAGNPAHIKPQGVKVRTLSARPAVVQVRTEHTGGEDVRVEITILDQDRVVARGFGSPASLTISDAALWNADHPHLYTCRVKLCKGEVCLDTEEVSFGIRTLSWSEKGFFVNGESTLLKGGCVHHDNGTLGARTFRESEYRRVKRLKDLGFNAVRSAHNPASRYLLEACDVLGMYVMDEGWDMWYRSKTEYDYSLRFEDHFQEDIASLVDRDYNHPSVVLYSIGNEVTEPAEEKGVNLGKKLIETFHALDDTRPVTGGINLMLIFLNSLGMKLPTGEGEAPKKLSSTEFNQMMAHQGEQMNQVAAMEGVDEVTSPILDALDIAGYNYASSRYAGEGGIHPQRVVVGSETLPQDLARNWKLVESLPYLIGDFMWTGWDYLGETGIGHWSYVSPDAEVPADFGKPYPFLLADTGVVDILGNENAEAGNAAVIWGARKEPYIAVRPVNHAGEILLTAMWRGSDALPSWSWKGYEGNEATVEVYSAGREVELILNGKSLGREKLENWKAEFSCSYEPGKLEAVSFDEEGKEISRSALTSASGKRSIRITPEEKLTKDDILYVDVDLTGENGIVESGMDTLLHVQVEGGELLSFGSALPETEHSFLDGEYPTYYGRAQAVIRKGSGSITIRVKGEGFEVAEAVVLL